MIIETKEQLQNLAWQEALRYKKIANTELYRLKKACFICNSPIPDSSRLGLCYKCNTAFNRRKIKSKERDIRRAKMESKKSKIKHKNEFESDTHKQLKEIGKAFLINLGCTNIVYEKLMGVNNARIKADVYGELDTIKYIVECGGSSNYKLVKASKLIDFVYILPYGESIPYIWNNNFSVCHSCGHIIKKQ